MQQRKKIQNGKCKHVRIQSAVAKGLCSEKQLKHNEKILLSLSGIQRCKAKLPHMHHKIYSYVFIRKKTTTKYPKM